MITPTLFNANIIKSQLLQKIRSQSFCIIQLKRAYKKIDLTSHYHGLLAMNLLFKQSVIKVSETYGNQY